MKDKEIKEMMHFAAEKGFFSLSVLLTEKQRKHLRKKGFIILPGSNTIIWAFASVNYDGLWELFSLNEKDSKYTLPEKLWIIAKKERSW